MIGRGALNIPNLSRVVKYNEPRMPWPDVVRLLQKYTRLEKQGTPGCTTWRGLNNGWGICEKNIQRQLHCFRRFVR